MSVSNNQPGDATTFNNAFMSRTSNTSTTGTVALNNTSSGGTISNLQQTVNNHTSAIASAQGAITDLQAADVSLDSRLDAIEALPSVATHEADTTNIHGIADTSLLVTTTGAQTLTNKTINGSNNTISNLTAAMVNSGAATSGQVLSANGSGGASWANVTGTGDFLAAGTVAMTGQFQASTSTSQSAPPITFSGDGNTGIVHPAADTIGMSTAGVERLRIDSNGQLFGVINSGSSLLPGFMCRAWVNFIGTGTVATRGGGNVTSVTDNGTGDWTVNLSTSMPDLNYAVIATVSAMDQGNTTATSGYSLRGVQARVMTTGTVRVQSKAVSNVEEDQPCVYVAIFR